MTNSTPSSDASDQFRGGNEQLCERLRAIGELHWLRALIKATANDLTVADSADKHDADLDDERLSQLSGTRYDKSVLMSARAHLEEDVRALVAAHGEVAGLFKGKLKDDTEEMLARALSGARQRLSAFRTLVENYTPPRKPHEIRRIAMSHLLRSAAKSANRFRQMRVELEDKISPDLAERFKTAERDLFALVSRVEALRDRTSQRMADHLDSCTEQLNAIADCFAGIELDAGLRSGCWFNDYGQRIAARQQSV